VHPINTGNEHILVDQTCIYAGKYILCWHKCIQQFTTQTHTYDSWKA